MKFSTTSVVAVLAAGASAKPAFTNTNFGEIEAGKPFVVTYENCNSPCEIILANGESTDLKPVDTLTPSASGGKFTWIPKAEDLDSGMYALEIKDGSGVNYSKQFTVAGASGSSSSSSSSDSASSTKTSSDSSSSTSSDSSATTTSTSTSTGTVKTTSTSTSVSKTSSSSSGSSATSRPSNTNDSPNVKSPLAFVLVAAGALLFVN